MKKMFLAMSVMIAMASCVNNRLTDEFLIIESVELMSSGQTYKVTLKAHNEGAAFFYSTQRLQAGDTLLAPSQFYDNYYKMLSEISMLRADTAKLGKSLRTAMEENRVLKDAIRK